MKKFFANLFKRLKNKLRYFNSFRRQMLLVFISLILICSFSVSYIGFITFRRALVTQIGNSRVDVLSQIGERAKLVKNSAKTLSNLYFYDTKLNSFLYTRGSSQVELKTYLDQITERYKIAFQEINIAYNVVLIGTNGFQYSSSGYAKQYDYDYIKKKIWYKDILLNEGDIYWVSDYKEPVYGQNVFSAARIIKDKSGNMVGTLLVNINEKLLNDTYSNILTSTNNIYIVDDEGSIVSSNMQYMLGINFFNMKKLINIFSQKPYTILDIGGRTVLFTYYVEPTTGWTFLEDIPIAEVTMPILNVRTLLIVITACVILLGLLAVYFLSLKFSKPILQLCDFLLDIQDENLDKMCTVEGVEEINILSRGLNAMLQRVKVLVDNIRFQEQQKRELEQAFLQAQINPHFMYNTLFSIKCMVDMEKNEEASKMLSTFVQLLRSTLSDPNELISLQQEIETLRQYVVLQQFRYAGRFKVVFDCDEATMKYRIPKMLLQPLVENAIFHGVEAKDDGIILITARMLEQEIIMTVEDNGVGMSEEVVAEFDKRDRVIGNRHVGVFNVKERIRLNFGNNYGLKIISQKGEGTKIVLNFPAIE